MPADDFEEEAGRREYKAPYSEHHPIPTIQKYREHRNDLEDQQEQAEQAQRGEEDESKLQKAYRSVKKIIKDEDTNAAQGDPYPTANRHTDDGTRRPGPNESSIPSAPSEHDIQDDTSSDKKGNSASQDSKDGGTRKTEPGQSATERAAGQQDPKKKRKEMKNTKRDEGGREVTDPVTHLPIVIRDSTTKDLQRSPENQVTPGIKNSGGTRLSRNSKPSSQLEDEKEQLQAGFEGMKMVFPPPSFDDTKAELARTYQLALTIAVGIIVTLLILVILVCLVAATKDRLKRFFITAIVTISFSVAVGIFVITGIGGWLDKKVGDIWEDKVWDAARLQEDEINKATDRLPESVAWMNSLLSSVWPLINPDLFASVIDMLEDVMQASLPKIIRMVSIDDLGQGSESIRILGVRWLPTGAADQSVDEDGNIKAGSEKEKNDRGAPGQGKEEDPEGDAKCEVDSEATKKKKLEKKAKDQEKQAMAEGMEAEQGDFVNMELAFAYRARLSGKSIKSKAKNAHLYLKFYLPGGIFVPVWVELRGIIGTMRLRLQLTPDPPFFSLCTLTFLGQPRADLSCVPLSKRLPNLMDVPLISSFVQSAIDAALAEYVAPKSLTLDLKDMLVGDDFKKDTVTRGVIVIFIKEANNFKEGDGGIGPIEGSSDSYVTCSWGKFGKTMSSTRIIEKDQHPQWHEWAYLLVSPEELNADEKLRLQLWDSDKHTADDDLGRVEVDLKELMYSPKTKNKMCDREDRFTAQNPEEKMPGTLKWSVGYFQKTRITGDQLENQKLDKAIQNKEDLRSHVVEAAKNKLREATAHDESKELDQQKAQDYRERENALICAAPPAEEYPSGVLSIQIHNITGLEVEALQKKAATEDVEDEAEESNDLPSSYCTIILNHKKIYTTRTKPKNSKPFFNAGTERFIRDWRNAEIMISVRDNRERENDALLGVIYLPLGKVFEHRSQVMGTFPLVGGIGFGRARVSLVFRSVEMHLPQRLLGWDYGTLEIKSPVRPKPGFPSDLQSHRIKLRSNIMHAKMTPQDGGWTPKHDKDDGSIFLACRKRYAMPLIIEFRKSSLVTDSTPAFAVFWLKDVEDELDKKVEIKVWKGGKENLKRATTCAGYNGLDEGEQPLGEIELEMRFWRGLGGYHKSFASKGGNENVASVMEVLDTVNDEIGEGNTYDDDDKSENPEAGRKGNRLKTHTNDSDSDSSDSDDGNNTDGTGGSTKNPLKIIKKKLDTEDTENDGSRGVVAQVKDYKNHRRQLHRKHRGVMQWRGMRTAEWAVGKVKGVGRKVEGIFEHQKKQGQEIETEV